MLVREPRLSDRGDEVVVEADFETGAGAPERGSLFFAVPRRLARGVDGGADAFAAALLPLAMWRREPLEVRGDLSLRLAAGMHEYQHLQCAWKPDVFGEVPLVADRLVTRAPAAGGVAASFSGGVDSFFTLMRRLPETEPFPAYRVDCCLMINGFDEDSSVDDPAGFAPLAGVYEPLMAALGVDLVVVRTNLLRVLGPWVRSESYGAFLTAVALLLGRRLSRFFVPSSLKFTTAGLERDGSHLMLDHLLSTESLDVVHDSADVTRVEKTAAIASWPTIHNLLRVCFRQTRLRDDGSAVLNCCRCEKCLRTMVALEAAGALARFGSFPLPLDRAAVRALDMRDVATRLFAVETIEFAERAGRRAVARDLRAALLASRHLWPRLGPLAVASHRLELRSPLWARLVATPKRALKRRGWGQGWLY